jgi:AcrR family transcriptional regulator
MEVKVLSRITKPVEVRRQEIIAAARTLFVAQGHDKTVVADIARQLHIAPGLVYHYFQSKSALLYAVIDEILTEEAAVKGKIVAEHEGKAMDCLSILLSREVQLDRYGELFPSLKGNQALLDYAQNTMAAATRPMALALIERGNKDGSWCCPYPQETTDFFLLGISGIVGGSEAIARDVILRLLGFVSPHKRVVKHRRKIQGRKDRFRR